MSTFEAAFVGKQFKIGMRRQKTWGADMAISFFFGEMGAGLFLLSLCFDFIPGVIAGLLITSIGKSVGHILHLGRPERAWRAIMKLGNSWLSRGLLAIILYTGFGGLYIINHFMPVLPEVISTLCAVIASAAAVMIMLYQGLIMSHSQSITLWASGLMPPIGLAYALLSGATLIPAAGYNTLMVTSPDLALVFKTLQLVLLLVVAACIWGLLHSVYWGGGAGRESVERLTKQDLSLIFIGAVGVIGLGLTTALVAFVPGSETVAWATVATQLAGFVSFRLLILKAGNFDPIMMAPRQR